MKIFIFNLKDNDVNQITQADDIRIALSRVDVNNLSCIYESNNIDEVKVNSDSSSECFLYNLTYMNGSGDEVSHSILLSDPQDLHSESLEETIDIEGEVYELNSITYIEKFNYI